MTMAEGDRATNYSAGGAAPRRFSEVDLNNLITEIASGPDNSEWEGSLHGARPTRDSVQRTIAAEQAAVDAKLRSAEPVFVITVSGPRRVHLPGCFHVQHVLDRQKAWETVLEADEDLTQNHLSIVSPPPHILTKAEVEGLNSYVTCQACAPTLDHQKKVWVLNAKPMLATNLGIGHIGRPVTSAAGDPLGQLVSHQRIVTAAGIRSITTTTQGTFEGDGTERYVIGPR